MLKSTAIKAFIFLAFVAVCLTACRKKEKFDRYRWNGGDGLSFPYRDNMLEDLLANHKLKGLTYKQVTQLLHPPDRNSFTDKSFEYEIICKMNKLDTVYAKTLILYLNKDSIVSDFKVVEKDNKEKLDKKFAEQNKKK